MGQIQALPLNFQDIKPAMRNDPTLSKVLDCVKRGWTKEVPVDVQPYISSAKTNSPLRIVVSCGEHELLSQRRCKVHWMKLQWESAWTVCQSRLEFVVPLLVYVQPLMLFFARVWSHLRWFIAWTCTSDFGQSSTLVVRTESAPLIHLSLRFFHPWILAQTWHYWGSSLTWHLAWSLCRNPATPSSGYCDCNSEWTM